MVCGAPSANVASPAEKVGGERPRQVKRRTRSVCVWRRATAASYGGACVGSRPRRRRRKHTEPTARKCGGCGSAPPSSAGMERQRIILSILSSQRARLINCAGGRAHSEQRPTCPRAMNCTQVRVVALRLHPSSTLCPTHDHACAATGGAARTSGIATPVLKQLRWLRMRRGAISVSRCRTQKVPTSKNGRVSQATGNQQLAARSAALRECCDAGPQRCDRMSHQHVAPAFTVSHQRSHVGLPKKCLARKKAKSKKLRLSGAASAATRLQDRSRSHVVVAAQQCMIAA